MQHGNMIRDFPIEDGTLRIFCKHYGVKATIQWVLYYWKRNVRIFKVDKLKIYYKR